MRPSPFPAISPTADDLFGSDNSIHAASAMIRVGISTGSGAWSTDEQPGDHEIAYGSEIVRNRLSSYTGYYGYAIAISDARAILVTENSISFVPPLAGRSLLTSIQSRNLGRRNLSLLHLSRLHRPHSPPARPTLRHRPPSTRIRRPALRVPPLRRPRFSFLHPPLPAYDQRSLCSTSGAEGEEWEWETGRRGSGERGGASGTSDDGVAEEEGGKDGAQGE